MRWTRRVMLLGISVATGLGSSGCATTDSNEPGVTLVPTTVALSGDGQTGTVGNDLPAPIGVTITDQDGNPMEGIAIGFTVTAGGGNLSAPSVATNAVGFASTTWTLGTAAGTNNNGASITVTGFTGTASSFKASADPGAPVQGVIVSGDGQSGMVGTTLVGALVVGVRDAYDNPVPGVTVVWEATSGGGWVESPSGVTGASGNVSVSRTLGATVGAQTTSGTASGLAPAAFTSTGTPLMSAYDIDVRFLTPLSPAATAAFTAAATRWRQVIIGDVSPFSLTMPAGACGPATPAVDETVDDIVIFVVVDSIDGVGGTIGSAAPCAFRGDPVTSTLFTPIISVISLDSADVAFFEAQGVLNTVAIHEMGHALGIGALWSEPLGFPSGGVWPFAELVVGIGTADPHYIGPVGLAQFGRLGGTPYAGIPVPVERQEVWHWRESVMGSELMTPVVGTGANPLSVVTIGSLVDGKFTVSYATAEAYALAAPGAGGGIRLHESNPGRGYRLDASRGMATLIR